MKISTVFDYSKINFSKENEVILMASISAPKIKTNSERAPLNLSLALDVSGSMQGQKLESVKKAVSKLVEQLSERDSVGVVTFGSYVQEVFSPSKMTPQNKASLISQIVRLGTNGCTNMSGGMLKSFEQLKSSDLSKGSVHRLLLFTDGCANEGLRTTVEFTALVSEQIKNNPITVSCFGFGQDHDENMLSNISDTGKGNFYFIKNIEDIAKTFARELGGLLTCYAQNVSIFLDINGKYGEFIEILNDLTCESPTKQRVKITLDDIYSEETKHLLIKVKLNKASKAVTQRASSVVEVLVTYNDMTEIGKFKEIRSKSKIQFVKAEESQKEQAIEVLEQMAIVSLSKAHESAKQFADNCNFSQAQHAYDTTLNLASILRNRGSSFGDIVGTSVSTASANLTASNYSSAHGKSLMNSSRGFKYMRAVDSDTSAIYANSTQTAMVDTFTENIIEPNSSGNITIDCGKLPPTGTAYVGGFSEGKNKVTSSMDLNSLNVGKQFISELRIDLTPDPSVAGREAKKKDGLNKRRSS